MTSKVMAKCILLNAAVVQAWLDGATIEYYSKTFGKWSETANNDPSWDVNTKYRVKPAPREWWINIYPPHVGENIMHPSKEKADSAAGGYRIECVHVKEVIE